MNLKIVLLSIILVLLSLGLGIAGGMFISQSNDTTTLPQIGQQSMVQAIKDLSSKVVPSLSAYGTVTKIDGQSVTLSYQGDSMVLPIKPDAKVYSLAASPTTVRTGSTAKSASTTQQIAFQNIKIGDNLSVNFKVLSSGNLEGFSAIVLPPAAPAAPATTK